LTRYDWYDIPSAQGGRYFFSRQRKDENRNSICMRNSLSGQDEVVINPADIDPDASTTVSVLSPPPDASFLPFRIRRGGADEFEVRILDLKTRGQTTSCPCRPSTRKSRCSEARNSDSFRIVASRVSAGFHG
jgi:prolyl oligopeptidase